MPTPNRPLTLEQTIQRLIDRIRRLERRPTNGVGAWRLEERPDGSLVARNTRTGVVKVLAP